MTPAPAGQTPGAALTCREIACAWGLASPRFRVAWFARADRSATTGHRTPHRAMRGFRGLGWVSPRASPDCRRLDLVPCRREFCCKLLLPDEDTGIFRPRFAQRSGPVPHPMPPDPPSSVRSLSVRVAHRTAPPPGVAREPRRRNLEPRNVVRIGCPRSRAYPVRSGPLPDSVHDCSAYKGS